MENEKRKYPIGPEHYALYEEIGQGVSASVHRALCVPFDEVVAIKILDFERDNCDLVRALEFSSSRDYFRVFLLLLLFIYLFILYCIGRALFYSFGTLDSGIIFSAGC